MNNLFQNFPTLAEKTVYITDGYMDLDGTPSLYLHGKARNIGNVRLTGNFGDQVLSNVRDLNSSSQKSLLLNEEFAKHIDHAATRLSEVRTVIL